MECLCSLPFLIWQELVPHSGPFSGAPTNLLAVPSENNAVEGHEVASRGLDSCYKLCLLHSSSAFILLALCLDADALLLLLNAHLVPSLLG